MNILVLPNLSKSSIGTLVLEILFCTKVVIWLGYSVVNGWSNNKTTNSTTRFRERTKRDKKQQTPMLWSQTIWGQLYECLLTILLNLSLFQTKYI